MLGVPGFVLPDDKIVNEADVAVDTSVSWNGSYGSAHPAVYNGRTCVLKVLLVCIAGSSLVVEGCSYVHCGTLVKHAHGTIHHTLISPLTVCVLYPCDAPSSGFSHAGAWEPV